MKKKELKSKQAQAEYWETPNEQYRRLIIKFINSTEDNHVLCCAYTLLHTYLNGVRKGA